MLKINLLSGLENITGLSFIEDDTMLDKDNFTISSSSKVGATIADDIQNSSLSSGSISFNCNFCLHPCEI